MSAPWQGGEASEVHATRPPPARCDVVVVGAGFAGALCAAGLAEQGVDVAVLDGRRAGSAGSGRQLGHVLTGILEHPYRVRLALGPERAAAFYSFCRGSVRRLAERVSIEGEGWWAATDPREPDQIRRSVEALQGLGVPAQLRPSDEVDAAFGGEGFGPAMVTPDDGLLAPDAIDQVLAQAREAGATFCGSSAVRGVEEDPDGMRVHTDGGATRAEVVVLAANAWLPGLDPWFADKIYPVREQALATAPLDRALGIGGRCGYGYTFWRQTADRRLVVGGARWATPHLEVGENDDARVVPAVQDRLEGFVARHFGLHDIAVTHRWSWIVGHTCDGLPIIGPLPGSPRTVVCAGFVGNQVGLAAGAAAAVCEGLVGAGEPDLPEWLTPGRFL